MSNNPVWETQDGQKWLAKALDPAGFQQVDLKGMPDQESHNVAVLNYQSQFAVNPPNMYNAPANDGATYESEMYFFQHPYMLGVAASFPTGTVDPMSSSQVLNVSFGSTTKAPYIKFNSSGQMFPRTCTAFINTQVNGGDNLKSTITKYGSYCQKSRVIYGAAQLIPSCSSQDNSGTISVSQQPFVGDDNGISSINASSYNCNLDNEPATNAAPKDKYTFNVKVYNYDDFPNADDNIRNPASLLTRFYEGAYIPYKLRNPFTEDFTVSDNQILQVTPYWVTGASYKNALNNTWLPMTWNADNSSFTTPMNTLGTARETVFCSSVALHFMTKTGQEISIVFNNTLGVAANQATEYFFTIDMSTSLTMNELPSYKNLLSNANSNDARIRKVSWLDNGTPVESDTNVVRYWRTNVNGAPCSDFPADNITAVRCKAMNMRGNITVLIRLGVEMQVTGNSTYSPFNHRSPQYDEAALKTYLRVIHRMSDGFFGNAATDMFHNAYYNNLIAQIYEPDSSVDFANRGSYWRGLVSANQ